jgi:hypothetical protein
MPLPVSMDTGRLIMLTKLVAKKDLTSYDFSSGQPVYTWQAADKSEM